MQLMLTTDYAVRCMLYLAKKNDCISSQEISKQCAIDRDFAQKILRKLRNAGLISVQMGATGGYSLSRPARDITIHEVLECMEDTMHINRCLEEDRFCTRGAADSCEMRAFYRQVQDRLDEILFNTTLQDIIDGKTGKTVEHILTKRGA